jgi:hypothetical protein
MVKDTNKRKLPPLRRMLVRGRGKGHDLMCSRFVYHDVERLNKCSCGRDEAEKQLDDLESQVARIAELESKIADLQDEVVTRDDEIARLHSILDSAGVA